MYKTLTILVALGVATPALAQFDPYAIQRQQQYQQQLNDQRQAQERAEQRQQFFEDQQRQKEQNCYASGGYGGGCN